MKKELSFAGITIVAVLYTGTMHAQSSVGKVLDAFAKTAKDNPNDTSSAELTMKALGNLMGGGGVSAADSVTAIKSFMSAKGGSGVHYQYATTIVSKQGTNTDTSAIYFTNSGDGRSDMNLPGMMGVKGKNKLIILAHAGQPHYSLTLDASNKTYSLNVIDTALINSDGISHYQVTKVGNETIQGYNCTHAKMVSTAGSGMFKSSITTDIWTSAAVPGYSLLKYGMAIGHTTPAMMQALEKAGCAGFLVKMTSQGKDVSSQTIFPLPFSRSLLAILNQKPICFIT